MEHSGAKSIVTIPSLVYKVQEAGPWVTRLICYNCITITLLIKI